MLLDHKAHRRCYVWLKDLADKGYVKGSFNRKKIGENNRPTVYHLTPRAIKVLREQEELKSADFKYLYEEDSRLQGFIEHCQLLGDIYLSFSDSVRLGVNSLYFLTKKDMATYEALPEQLPDAYISIGPPSGSSARYFLEIFDPDIPRFAVRRKILRFYDYIDSEEWERHHSGFPSIVLVTADEKMRRYVTKLVDRINYDSYEEIKFFVITKDEISSISEEIMK